MSKWPWVRRSQLELADKQAKDLFIENEYLKEEIRALITTKSNLTVMCNQLQTRLKDCTEPPISSADLKDTLRRLSFLQTQSEALEAKNQALAELVSVWRGRAESKSSKSLEPG